MLQASNPAQQYAHMWPWHLVLIRLASLIDDSESSPVHHLLQLSLSQYKPLVTLYSIISSQLPYRISTPSYNKVIPTATQTHTFDKLELILQVTVSTTFTVRK